MKNTAVAYLRVSTTEQAEHGASLEVQMERIRAYATMAGLELVAVLREEGVSGAKPLDRRPLGAELVRLIQSGAVHHVVALKLDRLFRDTFDCLGQTREWDARGVALHLVDLGGQTLNTGSAMGKMFLTMTAAFAELERNLIGERTSAALAVKQAQGVRVGAPPLGFSVENGRLVVDQAEGAVVSRIRQLRAAERPLRGIVAQLEAEGLRTKRGGRWSVEQVRRVLARA